MIQGRYGCIITSDPLSRADPSKSTSIIPNVPVIPLDQSSRSFQRRFIPSLFLLFLFSIGAFLLVGCASFRYGDDQYQITVGAHGKDVMWVPSKTELVYLMLEQAKVTKNDVLYDLGSGDGIIPIEAAKTRGVRSYGIEYNKDLVELSVRNAQRAGVSDLASFRHGDIFVEDFSDATVVTLYLGENLNLKLKPTLPARACGMGSLSERLTLKRRLTRRFRTRGSLQPLFLGLSASQA